MKVNQRVRVKSKTKGNHSEDMIGMKGVVIVHSFPHSPNVDWVLVDFEIEGRLLHTNGNTLPRPTGYWLPPEDLSSEVDAIIEILERYERV